LGFHNSLARAFNAVSIQAHAPDSPGLYGISNAREWILIGCADNIRGALFTHLQQSGTALLDRQPTGFSFELCAPSQQGARYGRLLWEYRPALR